MRRIVLLIAVALSVTLAYAQDADTVGNGAQLSIIPRLDLNPYIGYESPTEFGFANSGLYSLLEGTFAEDFSYTGYFHFLSADAVADLYRYPFQPGECSWLDEAFITYAPSDIAVTFGKNCMAIGTFEYDDWDHDCYFDINSGFWNNFQPYQWGGDVTFYFRDEGYATLQICASPYSERLFKDGLKAFSASLGDVLGRFSYKLSANFIDQDEDSVLRMYAGGARYATDKFGVTLDVMGRTDGDHSEITSGLTLAYNPCERLSLRGKVNFEDVLSDDWEEYFACSEHLWGGLICEYYPLRDSDALRLHAVLTHMPFAGQLSACIGATYNFTINIK